MKKSWVIRKDEQAVSPVIATILMVAITVVLAAVLYVMVTGLLAGPGATRPSITFTAADPITNGFQFDVAGASQSKPSTSYRMNFQVGAIAGTAIALAPSMSFTVSANTYTITWTDVGGENNVNQGDQFRVTRVGGLPAQTEFTARLLWTDGGQIQSSVYTSP